MMTLGKDVLTFVPSGMEGAESATTRHAFGGDNDYFRLAIFKKPRTQEEPLTFLLFPKKI